jgi:hypothetical protein
MVKHVAGAIIGGQSAFRYAIRPKSAVLQRVAWRALFLRTMVSLRRLPIRKVAIRWGVGARSPAERSAPPRAPMADQQLS